MNGRTIPAKSLTADQAESPSPAPSLTDILHEGFYLVLLLRNGSHPSTAEDFSRRVINYIDDFSKRAKESGHSAEDVIDAKYAFAALVDETVLATNTRIRADWERCPLQLSLFGDQLAGDHFFDRLEKARSVGKERIATVEVFHMCLLLGFKGRYRLERREQIDYLCAQLGTQLLHQKGKQTGFAPHWKAAEGVINRIERQTPAWVIGAVLALAGLIAFVGLRWHLNSFSADALEKYNAVVTHAEKLPSITISIP